jgi:DNA modification methylase
MIQQILHRDCLDMTGISSIKLIYLDPPYSCQSEDKFYGVGDTFEDYLSYMKARLEAFKTVLHPDGANVIIHLDFKAVHYVKVLADTIFGRENFRNEIAWCYASPSVAKSHLPRKHDTLLWYGINDYPFNQPYVPYVGKLKVGGKTSWNQNANETDYLDRGKKLEDYWIDIPSLCRNEGEKLGYKTQKPLALLERIVSSFSNEEDVILDPFAGSGTTGEAAKKLGRGYVMIDGNGEACEMMRKRLGVFGNE